MSAEPGKPEDVVVGKPGKVLEALEKHLLVHGGVALMGKSNGIGKTPDYAYASEWGQEAEDSPMAGAASYGLGTDVLEALEQGLRECRCLK